MIYLECQNEILKEALLPFAKAGSQLRKEIRDEAWLMRADIMGITAGDLRRATRAIQACNEAGITGMYD